MDSNRTRVGASGGLRFFDQHRKPSFSTEQVDSRRIQATTVP